MGMLVDGRWTESGFERDAKGAFARKPSSFRRWITADGSSGFKAEPGRYHLYVSLACPWAHRTLIVRALKHLEQAISVSVVHPVWHGFGWEFREGPGNTPDTVNGCRFLYEVYTRADRAFTGKVTVPVLWDREQETIVSNESSEIIRMLNSEFEAFGNASLDLYPAPLREEIDWVNARVYANVNNGVYRAGFAATQQAYEDAFDALFETLDELEQRLVGRRFLCGDRPTEADWRLFTTLLRFDAVYYVHFKCNERRVADYPALSSYLRDLYQHPGVRETCDFFHIKQHYYRSHPELNPSGIVPKGPRMNLDAPHQRADLRREGPGAPEASGLVT